MRSLTHDTYEIVVKRHHDEETFFVHAGQFATLKFPGIDKPRPYSFAAAPENDRPGEHTFFIRLAPDGEVSAWLSEADRTGEPVEIGGPFGAFGLDASTDPMICIAGGSGMSAIKSVIEHACNLQVERDCYFLYGARTQRDLYCMQVFEQIKARWPGQHTFEFVQVLSEEPPDSDWSGPRGFVTEHFKEAYLNAGIVDPARCKAFFCGPPPMIAAGVATLRDVGVSDDRMFRDVFEDASSPAPVIDNVKCVLCDECLLVKPVAGCIVEASELEVGEGGRVSGFDPIRPAFSSGLYYNALVIDAAECIRCYGCVDACPHDAISPDFAPVANTLRQRF